MRTTIRVVLMGGFSIALAFAGILVVAMPRHRDSIQRILNRPDASDGSSDEASDSSTGTKADGTDPKFPMFSAGGFENGGFATAQRFTGPVNDRSSLDEVRESIRQRVRRGKDTLIAELREAGSDTPMRAFRAQGSLALLALYEGNLSEAAAWTEKAMSDTPGLPAGIRSNLEAMLGVIEMRRGETENCLDCLGPSSCIFPIAPEGVHLRKSGSRAAIEHFKEYLDRRPDDLGVRWLLNLTYMTLGEYPEKVPVKHLIPLDTFLSNIDVGRFENVAPLVGLSSRGMNMAGGSIFDDFTGDGRPDLFITSLDLDLGASLFVNRGDGTFDDRSKAWGLDSQQYGINAAQADFDNDGRLDVVIVRGGWDAPCRMSLLRNKADGTFEDVTVRSGLVKPISSHSAAWADFDNDGHLDLFVCGEYATSDQTTTLTGNLTFFDPRNSCRLYRNQGDGTFADVGDSAGVRNNRYAKGACWGDFDDDGRIDLFVSNLGAENRLYHNNGDGTFTDVAGSLGLTGPRASFSCWFWDFDNDGRLDIYVNQYLGGLYDAVASALGRRLERENHPRLFRNLGPDGFRDVSLEVGLDKTALAMGASFGDIDNDGFLDIYLGTGQPAYSALVPNLLYKNMGGKGFEDVTTSSGTGHLQKGHGVSLADYDEDGDLDLFVQTGGAVPGDRARNILFRNPGHKRHWLKLKLVGTKSNRAAFGARIQMDLTDTDGKTRTIHRQIGGGASYGGNTLVQSFGLGDRSTANVITVTWPASRMRQVFRDVPADQTIEVTEGNDALRSSRAGRSTTAEGL